MFLSCLKDENTNMGTVDQSKKWHRIVITINDDPSKSYAFIVCINDKT